jgi:hypothetical protein
VPTEPQPVTMSRVVRRAVEVCEDSTSTGLDELLQHFEDDDDPVALLQLATQAEFHGQPPQPVARCLADQGITV